MAQPTVGQRLSAAEYLFSVSSQPRLQSVAKFERGSRKVRFWVCEADKDHREHGFPLVTRSRSRRRAARSRDGLQAQPYDVQSAFAGRAN